MRLSMVMLLTGALAWGCSSDETPETTEAVTQDGTTPTQPASVGTTTPGTTTTNPTTGGQGGWQQTTTTTPSVAMEAANDTTHPTTTTTNTTTTTANTTPTGETWMVKAFVLNVRSGPGTKHAKVRTLRKGEKVDAFEKTAGWTRIGTQEWVNSSYLTK